MILKFFLKPTDPAKLAVDTLILFSLQDQLNEAISKLPIDLVDLIKQISLREEFTGKDRELLSMTSHGDTHAYKILVVGIGKKDAFTISYLQEKVAGAIKRAKEGRPVSVGIVIPPQWFDAFTPQKTVQHIVESVTLALYQFHVYKSDKDQNKRHIEEIVLSVPPSKLSAAEQGLNQGLISSDAVTFARDLINEPPYITTPAYLADAAITLSKNSKGIVKTMVLEKEEIRKLGMNAFIGVAQGSEVPPKFIILKYKGVKSKKKIVLVGKGITFDTGGLSIKDAKNMETMKLDMSGAAAVLAVFKAISILRPNVEVVGIIAACENMPSGKALKPGDILKAMNGKTIEVLNTDAEGRLTLADAFSYAAIKEKPDMILDLSTLTGACMIALGEDIAGMWGNNEEMVKMIDSSAEETGERIWRLPLEKSYQELIKSHIADLKNVTTTRYGGAITAALFLEEFVNSIPWIHMDIAGPAFCEKEHPLTPIGGTGFGVRLLLHFILTQ